MGVGQVITDTFRTVKQNLGSLLVLWALFLGITIVLFFALTLGVGTAAIAGLASMGTGEAPEGGSFAALGGMIVFMILFYVGYLLVAMAQYASMITLASPVRQTTVNEALGSGWRSAPALLLLMALLLIAYFAVAMVAAAAGAAFSAMGEGGPGLLALLLLPVLVWLGCRLSPLFAVVAVDGVRNPFTAIARAWHLTRGHALTIFLASLVFLLILAVLCGLALLPSIGVLRTLGDPTAMADPGVGAALGGMGLFLLSLLVISALFNVCYCAFLAVIHGTLSNAAGEGTAAAFA